MSLDKLASTFLIYPDNSYLIVEYQILHYIWESEINVLFNSYLNSVCFQLKVPFNWTILTWYRILFVTNEFHRIRQTRQLTSVELLLYFKFYFILQYFLLFILKIILFYILILSLNIQFVLKLRLFSIENLIDWTIFT